MTRWRFGLGLFLVIAIGVPLAMPLADLLRHPKAWQAWREWDRLIELAFQAPQWAQHIAEYFGWPGFQEGLWWFLAHMPFSNEGVRAYGPQPERPEGETYVGDWERIVRDAYALPEGIVAKVRRALME